MAQQTGQYGYLFMFDKVNATARHMTFWLHLGMNEYQVKGSLIGLLRTQDFLALCNLNTPRNPRDREDSPGEL